MPDYDWEAIRQEYIADPTTSFRKLAAKYGMSRGRITDRAIKERWYEKRCQISAKAGAKFEEALVAGAERDAETILKARSVLAARALEMAATATRPSDIINLTNALQILAKMTGLQPELDEREQKARIASIEAKSQVQEEDTEAGVFMIPQKWEDEADDDE